MRSASSWRAGRGVLRRGWRRVVEIVLTCAEPDVVYAQLARRLGVTAIAVINVRKRFAASRLGGLVARPRTGRPKADLVLTDDERGQLDSGHGGRSPLKR
jgi:transposase-like protein